MSQPVSVGAVTAAGYEAAARLLFAQLPPDELARRVERFLGMLATGELDPAGLLVAKRGGELVAAAVVQFLPGGSAVVVPPLPVRRGAGGEGSEQLAAHIVAQLRDRGIPLAYTFLDPADAPQADPLVRHGFRFVTQITHMLRIGADLRLPAKPSSNVRFTPAADDPAAFGQTLLATYDGTLDVPEACTNRPAEDILSGYRVNQPDPPHWWLARDATGAPVGVVLLTVTDPAGGMELGYLGLAPAARGNGLGNALVRHAVRAAHALGFPDLNLSVDERNEPALRVYRAHSFRPYQWQRVYLWRPSW